jgi:hypothetical protein
MYRFQINAVTQPGETIALVGADSGMGGWDVAQSVPLRTSRERYPLWWVDLDLKDATGSQLGDRSVDYKIDYKYVRIDADGQIAWETPGTPNRWVPMEAQPLPSPIIVEDGLFGTIQPAPYGYFANPLPQPLVPPTRKRSKWWYWAVQSRWGVALGYYAAGPGTWDEPCSNTTATNWLTYRRLAPTSAPRLPDFPRWLCPNNRIW